MSSPEVVGDGYNLPVVNPDIVHALLAEVNNYGPQNVADRAVANLFEYNHDLFGAVMEIVDPNSELDSEQTLKIGETIAIVHEILVRQDRFDHLNSVYPLPNNPHNFPPNNPEK